ncbi:hypothetical protein NEUTE1DRAFT_49770, partial [Neurospora tetrasperma FGSC 2508]
KSRIENLNDTTDNDKLVGCEEKGQEQQYKIAGDGDKYPDTNMDRTIARVTSFGKEQALPDWEEWCVFCLPARSSACFLQRRHGDDGDGDRETDQRTGLDWTFKLYVWFVIGHLVQSAPQSRRAGQRAGLKPGLKPALTVPRSDIKTLATPSGLHGACARPSWHLITDVEQLKGWVHSF